MVTIGIDAHKRTHTAVAVDEQGRRLGSTTCASTDCGQLALLAWATGLGSVRRWAVEDCRHLSRRLEAALLGIGRADCPGTAETDGEDPRQRPLVREV